ncbi:MAG: hypothetical protein ABIH37_02570 [archaeon]
MSIELTLEHAEGYGDVLEKFGRLNGDHSRDEAVRNQHKADFVVSFASYERDVPPEIRDSLSRDKELRVTYEHYK